MFDTLQLSIEDFLARFSIPSPWGTDLLDSITVVAAGLSFLFFVLFVMSNRAQPAERESTRPVRQLLRKARKAERKGNHEESGELFISARHYLEAAKAFIKINDYERAANACLLNNDYSNAAQCFIRTEEYEKAAELFIKARDYTNAAENFLFIGRVGDAAPLFVKGGNPVKAADCYARVGFYQKAGELLFEAQQYEKAAPFLVRTLQERASRRDQSLTLEEDAVSGNLSRMAAGSYLKSGQKLKAAQSFELGGVYAEAAALFEELGEKGKASDFYMKIGDTSSAARILESSDSAGEGALRVAEALLEEGKPIEAAEIFARLGEWKRAAGLFIENDLHDLAVEAYTKHGDLQAAAGILVDMGKSAEAANLLMSNGKAEEAAQIYRKLGEKERELEALLTAGAYYQAGRNFFELGKQKEATEILQRVEEGNPDFKEANRLLGGIFYDQQQWSPAIAYYQKGLADEEVQRENIDPFYRLAVALKEEGELQGSLSILEKVLMVDYHYRDVKDQVQKIKKTIESSSAGPDVMAGSSPDATIPGQTVARSRKAARYEIIEELGRGGMGVVYKARDTLLDRIIAYKVMPPQVQKNQKIVDMFLREAQSAARLSHPNIVTIYDADQERGEFFIIMELIEGESLKQILERQVKFPTKTALVLAGQVFKALAYAHSKGIVHRDIKPANLLWAKSDKQVKITDFGLARAIEEGRKTHTQMAGTPYYMSPEQILGGEVDHRADQYAMGVTLYEFVTGTVPFKEGDVLYHHVHTRPPSPDTHNHSLPKPLSEFILKCLAKEPQNRFSDINAALVEMRKLIN
jgi:tetratricopeptide (TPR) repeat protein